MKITAMGWLTAGVLAAGLNASYHDGGLQWAHQVADRIQDRAALLVDRASEGADRLLVQAQVLAARNETASCPLSSALARVQNTINETRLHEGMAESKIAHSEAFVEDFDRMSARQEAQFARLEAAQQRMQVKFAAKSAHFKIASAAFAPMALKSIPAPVCPRVRVTVPRIKMPAMPQIHIETSSQGPV